VSQVNEYRQHRFVRPPGATELLLVRHGESEPARAGEPFPMVDGQGDPALHPEGHEQAQRVAERLQVEDIAAIYVTTLRRTVQTATPLAERLGLPPIVEPDLREVHLGEWEGGSFRKHVAEGHPLALKMRAEQRWDVIPGAEPADRFADRVRDAIVRLATRHRDQCIAVFSHGGSIGQVLAHACGARPFAFAGSDNGAISHVVVTGDRWVIRCYNDAAHLRPAFSTTPEPLT
jgi:2,3-bisphosphoglycerate-dependent phosphoglycerate mutase